METFEFSSGPLKTKVEIIDEAGAEAHPTSGAGLRPRGPLLRTKQAFRWLEVPFSEIVSAELREPAIGDQLHLHIKCHPGTKPQKLLIFALGGEASFLAFVAAFKQRFPAMVDSITPDTSDLLRARRYAIGGRILFHSLPRWGVLLLWWCLAPAILPLFVAIYLSSRYRVLTDGEGMTVLRFRTHRIPWSAVSSVDRLKIEQYVNGIRSTNLFRYTVGKVTFLMTGRDARHFEAELKARGINF